MSKTTLIIMGYNNQRMVHNKETIFQTYGKMKSCLDKIIFIWNNQEQKVPIIPEIDVDLKIISTKRNSLCNRHYLAYKYVNTESVLLVDDDMYLQKGLVEDLISIWDKNKHKVIGYSKRGYTESGDYHYTSDSEFKACKYIITIGQTLMYHKKYMLEFAKDLKLQYFIDNIDASRSDDLSLQMMVKKFISKEPSIIVNSNYKIIELHSEGSVSGHKNRKQLRSQAIRWLYLYFNLGSVLQREEMSKKLEPKYRDFLKSENIMNNFMQTYSLKKCIQFFMKNPYINYNYESFINKYLVKDLIKPFISFAKVYGYFTNIRSLENFDFKKLPQFFVIKGVHGWNMNMICYKNTFSFQKHSSIFKIWLQHKASDNFNFEKETQYGYLKPGIIIEEYLGKNLEEYKLNMFNGELQFIIINDDTYMNIYDSSWNLLPFCKKNYSNYSYSINKPEDLDTIIKVGKKLCDLIHNPPFVRIDIININGKLYFGEFTFTPAAATNHLQPIKYDNYYGSLINLKTSENINSFVFIIPSFNNQDWYFYNLESIRRQKYTNWRIIYIDDASEDDNHSLVQKYIETYQLQDKFILLQNHISMKQAYSRKLGYELCEDDEICIMLDGDDWLLHVQVLSILNTYYNKYSLNCSYGQYCIYENGHISKRVEGTEQFPEKIIKNNSYRKYNWISKHLRTARAPILKNMPEEILQDCEGKWLEMSTDKAEMLYVLEQSGGKHMNIGEPLLVYNADNSRRYNNSYFNTPCSQKRQEVEYYIHNKIDSNLYFNILDYFNTSNKFTKDMTISSNSVMNSNNLVINSSNSIINPENTQTYQYYLSFHTVFILNENINFLEEFITYYLHIGFQHIYLYDNEGSIGRRGSTAKHNKYDFPIKNYNTREDIEKLKKILEKFKNKITYIKWQPKDQNGNIIYGQIEAIEHFIKNYGKYNCWVAFMDLDEFIFSPNNTGIIQFLNHCDSRGENCVKILQKKFKDRHLSEKKLITQEFNCIDMKIGDEWGTKNIIKCSSLQKCYSIHTMDVEGKSIIPDINTLRFNHYNLNKKQLSWMEKFYKKSFEIKDLDTGFSKYEKMLLSNY